MASLIYNQFILIQKEGRSARTENLLRRTITHTEWKDKERNYEIETVNPKYHLYASPGSGGRDDYRIGDFFEAWDCIE